LIEFGFSSRHYKGDHSQVLHRRPLREHVFSEEGLCLVHPVSDVMSFIGAHYNKESLFKKET